MFKGKSKSEFHTSSFIFKRRCKRFKKAKANHSKNDKKHETKWSLLAIFWASNVRITQRKSNINKSLSLQKYLKAYCIWTCKGWIVHLMRYSPGNNTYQLFCTKRNEPVWLEAQALRDRVAKGKHFVEFSNERKRLQIKEKKNHKNRRKRKNFRLTVNGRRHCLKSISRRLT